MRLADESGSDEDFTVEDDDDSDYGRSKKRGKKVIRRGRPDKKEKKSPKPRLKATGERSSRAARRTSACVHRLRWSTFMTIMLAH